MVDTTYCIHSFHALAGRNATVCCVAARGAVHRVKGKQTCCTMLVYYYGTAVAPSRPNSCRSHVTEDTQRVETNSLLHHAEPSPT